MNYLSELEISLKEYIENVRLNNIMNLKIHIADFNGSFNFHTDHQFMGYFKAPYTLELCCMFSFTARSRKQMALLKKIKATGCLSGFNFFQNKDNIVFVKKTNNNVAKILNTVENIVTALFPDINPENITVELKRVSGWHQLKEIR